MELLGSGANLVTVVCDDCDDSGDSLLILEIESPRKKPVAGMEVSEAEGDNGASVFERAAGVHEPALLEDPAGGPAAPPSAKEVFENLVTRAREQCAKVNVNSQLLDAGAG